MTANQEQDADKKQPFRPVRAAIFRGLGVVLPPLLTIAIFFWIGGIVQRYVYRPVTVAAREVILWGTADIRPAEGEPQGNPRKPVQLDGKSYRRVEAGDDRAYYIPEDVYDFVREHPRVESMPQGAKEIYRRYVELRWLQRYDVILVLLCGFVLLLYLLGKFMAAGAGVFVWGPFERGITRVPLVRNVYSSVKQVSDFLLSERNIEYSRVVAVEWPRKGVWCIALVTGSSLRDIQAAANEEVLSVLVCTSPMPMTGFTVTVKKSETIDLNISIDQAIQFVVSCGVVVPQDDLERMQSPGEPRKQLTVSSDSSEPASDED